MSDRRRARRDAPRGARLADRALEEPGAAPRRLRAARARLGATTPSRSTARDCAEFVGSRDASWRGLSLTMPLKQDVLPLLDEVDELAVLTGAANTVLFADGAPSRFQHGCRRHRARARRGRTRARARPGVLIGGGSHRGIRARRDGRARRGDACGVLLRRPEAAVPIVAARPSPRARRARCAPLAELARLDDGELVVSTVPGGADLGVAASEALMRRATLLDVAYSPWPTTLAAQWFARRRHGRARARDAAAPGAAAGADLRRRATRSRSCPTRRPCSTSCADRSDAPVEG